MTNEQLYIALGVPALINTALVGFVLMYMNAKFKAVDVQLRALNDRMGHMQEMWRSELRRVEKVLDARLKHLEER